jgi:hypothetical protein
MKSIKSISIPEPCSQQWQQMTPVDGGRHCERCCKTVVDFTAMADVEIISYFAVKNNVCGRFNEPQLPRINLQLNRQDAKSETGWKKWVMTTAMLASTVFYKAAGQTNHIMAKAEQASERRPGGVAQKKVPVAKERVRVIEGRIVSDVCTPLPGATVRAVGVDIAQPTDTNGYFKLHLPKAIKQFTVSYIGFETETIAVDSLQNGIQDLKLTPQIVSMNSVVVISGYNSQRRSDITGGVVSVRAEMVAKKHCWLWRMYYKYIRTPIHHIFY